MGGRVWLGGAEERCKWQERGRALLSALFQMGDESGRGCDVSDQQRTASTTIDGTVIDA